MSLEIDPQVKELKIYRNSDIVKIAAFIPPCHKHLRLIIVTKDQAIVLHEATVAAIARAYIDIISHPTRRAVELIQARLGEERKSGYAEYQLVESGRPEAKVVDELSTFLNFGKCSSG